jgi:hypothetical protein
MAKAGPNWGDIRTDWLGTSKSLRDLSSEHGVPESTIRLRAQKEMWGPRNAAEQKRALVNAGLAGAAHPSAHCAGSTGAAIAIEANQDIQDMLLGASVGRTILQRIRDWLSPDKEGKVYSWAPKDLKTLAEGARVALETIRRARGLDDPQKVPPDPSSKINVYLPDNGRDG